MSIRVHFRPPRLPAIFLFDRNSYSQQPASLHPTQPFSPVRDHPSNPSHNNQHLTPRSILKSTPRSNVYRVRCSLPSATSSSVYSSHSSTSNHPLRLPTLPSLLPGLLARHPRRCLQVLSSQPSRSGGAPSSLLHFSTVTQMMWSRSLDAAQWCEAHGS